ncbi:MAG: gliding motility-associated C-terminal domain-containing protein [Bacteroidia bacterium]|nr:gliding motility-associated C-terminal domain-containing protein [Bacteroidia bacterium]
MKARNGVVLYLMLLLFLMDNPLCAQTNLIPNHSFEEYIKCPDQDIWLGNDISRFVKDWLDPGYSATQYFNSCAYGPAKLISSVPTNLFGIRNASDGNAYIAIRGYGTTNARNYPGVKLMFSLIKGQSYKVGFKASLADSSSGNIDKLGMLFYENNPMPDLYSYDINGPCVIFPNRAHLISTKQLDTSWNEVSGIFKADLNYNYCILGNLFDSSITHFVRDYTKPSYGENGQHQNVVMYYIDDVSVTEYGKRIVFTDTIFCINDTLNIAEGGQAYVPFFWSFHANGSDTISLDSNLILTHLNHDTTIYLITPLNTDSVRFYFYPPPVVSIIGSTTLCNDSILTLKSLLNKFQLHVKYKWSTGEASPEIKVANEGIYKVTVTLGSCRSTDEKTVKYCTNSLFVPNAFTPDHDNLNDNFEITSRSIEKFNIEIYDKWGKQVFSSNNLLHSWDGTYVSISSPSDVYFYQINYTTKQEPLFEKILKGTITLLR